MHPRSLTGRSGHAWKTRPIADRPTRRTAWCRQPSRPARCAVGLGYRRPAKSTCCRQSSAKKVVRGSVKPADFPRNCCSHREPQRRSNSSRAHPWFVTRRLPADRSSNTGTHSATILLESNFRMIVSRPDRAIGAVVDIVPASSATSPQNGVCSQFRPSTARPSRTRSR